MKNYNYLYKITDTINNKIYIGVHSTNNLDDGYMGSGKLLRRAINSRGLDKFKKEILRFYESADKAYAVEKRIVNQEFVNDPMTYNTKIGGDGGWDHLRKTFLTIDNNGKFYRKSIEKSNGQDTLFTAIDKDGNTFSAFKGDNRLRTGDIRGVTYNNVVVKDKDGNTMQVSIDDPRYLSGELVGIAKGKINVKDKYSNTIQVSVDDPRYLSGELVPIIHGKIMVKDKDEKYFQVDKDDPRFLSGELVGVNLNRVTVKDKDGNTMQVANDDPRYLSGELISIHKNKIMVKDKDGNILQVSVDDPRLKTCKLVGIMKGRKHNVVTCPWCGKTGRAGGLKSFHFDYCKDNPNRKHRKPMERRIFICPHCGKEGKGGNMKRYHFDLCKTRKLDE